MEKFNERLKQLREELGVSMYQLANAIEVSPAAICKWENGVAEPKITYLVRLAEFFDCSTDYLTGKTDDFGMTKQTNAPPPLKLTVKEKQLIEYFRKLNENQKTLIVKTIKAWKNINDTAE